jgi:DNA polymerase
MLVGEQPGDQEDRQGAPFVGPAGRVLREALDEIGIPQDQVFVTNAVKHFKFVQRGRLRLHQNPRMSEITACKPWLMAEIDAVKPKMILCLGASAAKSLLGGTFALMRERGVVKQTPFAERVMATIHPSAVLRAQDEQGRAQLYGFLRDDLALAYLTAQNAA